MAIPGLANFMGLGAPTSSDKPQIPPLVMVPRDPSEPDDRVKLLDELPPEVCHRIIASLSPEKRKVTQAILGYPPRSVGRRSSATAGSACS